MVYVLELSGKGADKADSIILRVFNSNIESHRYTSEFTRIEEKYWTRFVPIKDNEMIENLYRDI